MSGLEYTVLLLLLLVLFPFSLIQMRVSLDQEDMEGFCIWTCLASFIAGLPFMVIFSP
jgi:hypothetical protein